MSWPFTKSSVQTEQARPLSVFALSKASGLGAEVPGWVSVVTVSGTALGSFSVGCGLTVGGCEALGI
jgi:hypothetical protein